MLLGLFTLFYFTLRIQSPIQETGLPTDRITTWPYIDRQYYLTLPELLFHNQLSQECPGLFSDICPIFFNVSVFMSVRLYSSYGRALNIHSICLAFNCCMIILYLSLMSIGIVDDFKKCRLPTFSVSSFSTFSFFLQSIAMCLLQETSLFFFPDQRALVFSVFPDNFLSLNPSICL